jgi:hypothetical protein
VGVRVEKDLSSSNPHPDPPPPAGEGTQWAGREHASPLILIGQYDSSFVRRVGIALTLYGIAFEHRPWACFGDAARLRAHNPLTGVPTLVFDDGPARHRAIRVASLATGQADIAVARCWRHALEAVPDVLSADCFPALSPHVERAEELSAIRAISQPFVAPV